MGKKRNTLNPNIKYLEQYPKYFSKQLADKYKKFLKTPSAENIRVKAVKLPGENWGSGLDERYATRLLKKNKFKLNSSDIKKLYHERTRTSSLIFVTKSTTNPLSGHPGALKNHQGRLNSGMITSEHGTRDRAREEAVEIEGNDGEATRIKSKLATIKYMISSGEEIMSISKLLSKVKKPVFSIHSNIGDLKKSGNLQEVAMLTQNVRESLKWDAAEDMMTGTFKNLVPVSYSKYLKKGEIASVGMGNFQKDEAKNLNRKPRSRSLSSETDNLNEDLSSLGAKKRRILSPPRTMRWK